MTRLVIHIVLPVVTAVLIIAAFIFIVQATKRRTRSNRAAYNVGRQEARMAMQINLLRAFAALVVGLVLFGVYLLLPDSSEAEPDIELTMESSLESSEGGVAETAVSPTNTPISAATPMPTDLPPAQVSTLTPIPTSPPTASPTSEPEPTATATEVGVKTAVVTSGVGVWLRSAPSVNGEQMEWLLAQTEVTVLEGWAAADEFEWQEVQAPSGNVGWVALPFIEFSEP